MAVVSTYSLSAEALPRFNQVKKLNPSSVPNNSVQRDSFTVSGLTTDMKPLVRAPALETGLFIMDVFVSAADKLDLIFINPTNASINPSNQDFEITAF